MNKGDVGLCFGPASGLSVGQLIPLAKKAEAAGFNSIWTGEFGSDCLAWVQAFATVTQNCRIGSSIANIYLRHPTAVAAAAAAIDEVSNSRLILGLGASHRSIVEESLGLEMVRPLEYLEEYVQIVKAILTGNPVYFQGSYFKVQGFKLAAGTLHAQLPIYVAALGLTAVEKAAQYADGVLLTLTPPDYERKLVQRLHSSARLAGRDPDSIKVVQILPCFIGPEDAAEMSARQMICRYTALPFYGNMFAKAGFQQEVDNIKEALARNEPEQACRAVSLPMLEALAATRNLSACQQAVERHRKAGADLVVLYPNAVASETSQAWYEAINSMIEA